MFPCRLTQCTSEPTIWDANVLFAENVSPDHGFCKVTFALTQVNNIITDFNAPIKTVLILRGEAVQMQHL